MRQKKNLHTGTRERIVREVLAWAKNPREDCRVQVIYGPAGIGKSSLARAVSEALADTYLGASFFFYAGIQEWRDPYLFFPTIAYQLAFSRPKLLRHIVDAVEKHMQHGDSQGIMYQGRELLLNLLSHVSDHDLPLVLVVDGFDECLNDPGGSMAEILKILCQAGLENPFLRILITTRPEPYIMDALPPTISDDPSIRMRDLWKDAAGDITNDIHKFIQDEFNEFTRKETFTLLRERPGCVSKLTGLSGGLFAYASMVVRYFSQHKRLAVDVYDTLLGTRGSGGPSQLHNSLDSLYSTILHNAFDEFRTYQQRMDDIRLILAWVVTNPTYCSASQLHPIVKIDITMDIIERLRSVLAVHGEITLTTRMQPCHASFPQYLTNPSHCSDADFLIESRCIHALIASCLLDILARDDINASSANHDGALPLMWEYARRHWVDHLLQGQCTRQLRESLHSFARNHLDEWLADVEPWLHPFPGQARAVDRIVEVRNWCKVCFGRLSTACLAQIFT